MTSQSNPRSHSLGAVLNNSWNSFARTPPGDMFATLVTIAMMFGAMFGCASLVVLGTDGVELLLHPH